MDAQTILMPVQLYTDTYVARGTVATRHTRLSDLLNAGERDFLVLEEAVLEEFATGRGIGRSKYAQINLGTVLFATSDHPLRPAPGMHVVKVPERALIILPPFRLTGRIHLPPEAKLRTALMGLTGRFVPVTEVALRTETMRPIRRSLAMVAVNHARAQILAPYEGPDAYEMELRPGA